MTAIDDGQRREKRRSAASLVFGTLFALAGVLLYVLWDLPKAWEIILPMRLSTAGAFFVAAAAVGCATVVFHTLTHNDILTPSLLGFDALYVLINTLLVFFLGTQALLNTDNLLFFFINIAVMIAFAVAIFAPLLLRPSVGVEVLLLIGVTCGLLIRSITALLQRLLDPQAYMVLADTFFASLESVNPLELGVAAFVVVAAVLGLWMARHHLDVLALGRERATELGVRYRRSVSLIMLSSEARLPLRRTGSTHWIPATGCWLTAV